MSPLLQISFFHIMMSTNYFIYKKEEEFMKGEREVYFYCKGEPSDRQGYLNQRARGTINDMWPNCFTTYTSVEDPLDADVVIFFSLENNYEDYSVLKELKGDNCFALEFPDYNRRV